MKALALALLMTASPALAEDWKGEPDSNELDMGGLAGLSITNGQAGFALLGTASKKIVRKGFADDINNSVSVETQLGPVFVKSDTIFNVNVHLRWDFGRDEKWIFYALGGIGGFAGGDGIGRRAEVYPRFGLGAFLNMAENFRWRAEVSHELIGVGITVPFWTQ
jgi:hypothetical protein